MRTALLAVLLVFPTAVSATALPVLISTTGPEAPIIEKSLAARLNSTDRYRVTNDVEEAYLHISITCLLITAPGFTCSVHFTIFPNGSTIDIALPNADWLLTHFSSTDVAERVFVDFVEATKQPLLDKAELRFAVTVSAFCKQQAPTETVRAACRMEPKPLHK